MRKVRFAGRGKGKSGGFRIMSVFVGDDLPVYLLAALSKGERANFSAREIAMFKAMTNELRRPKGMSR